MSDNPEEFAMIGQPVRARMCNVSFGIGKIVKVDALVWVEINGQTYPFYPEEVTPI